MQTAKVEVRRMLFAGSKRLRINKETLAAMENQTAERHDKSKHPQMKGEETCGDKHTCDGCTRNA